MYYVVNELSPHAYQDIWSSRKNIFISIVANRVTRDKILCKFERVSDHGTQKFEEEVKSLW